MAVPLGAGGVSEVTPCMFSKCGNAGSVFCLLLLRCRDSLLPVIWTVFYILEMPARIFQGSPNTTPRSYEESPKIGSLVPSPLLSRTLAEGTGVLPEKWRSGSPFLSLGAQLGSYVWNVPFMGEEGAWRSALGRLSCVGR